MSTHLQRLTESTLDHCQIYPEQKAAILYGFVHLTHEDLRAKRITIPNHFSKSAAAHFSSVQTDGAWREGCRVSGNATGAIGGALSERAGCDHLGNGGLGEPGEGADGALCSRIAETQQPNLQREVPALKTDCFQLRTFLSSQRNPRHQGGRL